MSSSEYLELVVDLWALFETNIPAKSKVQVAEQYLKVLEDNGIYVEEMHDFCGHNKHLDKAMEILYPIERDEELDDYDE